MTPSQILQKVKAILPDHFDHEDIASEIWLSSWLSHGKPDSEDVPVQKGIIYGRCVDAIRHRSVQERLLSRVATQPEQDVHDHDAPVADLNLIVWEASPSDLETKVIFQYFYLGRTISEGAAATGISANAFSSVLKHTLERLRAAARRINASRELHLRTVEHAQGTPPGEP